MPVGRNRYTHSEEKQWELSTSKTTGLLYNNVHSTFSSEVRLERFLFFEVFEDFDYTVAFSDGISVKKKKKVKSLIQRYRAGKYLTYINPLFKHQTYSDESCAQTNSCAEPKLLFLKAMAV